MNGYGYARGYTRSPRWHYITYETDLERCCMAGDYPPPPPPFSQFPSRGGGGGGGSGSGDRIFTNKGELDGVQCPPLLVIAINQSRLRTKKHQPRNNSVASQLVSLPSLTFFCSSSSCMMMLTSTICVTHPAGTWGNAKKKKKRKTKVMNDTDPTQFHYILTFSRFPCRARQTPELETGASE